MIERGQETRLPLEPRAAIRVVGEFLRQDFDRDVAFEPRIARAIHLTHAAGAEVRVDAVRAELPADHGLGRRDRIELGGGHIEKRVAFGIAREQGLHFGTKPGVGGRGVRHERGTGRGVARQRLVIDLRDLTPALRCHIVPVSSFQPSLRAGSTPER